MVRKIENNFIVVGDKLVKEVEIKDCGFLFVDFFFVVEKEDVK